MKKGVLVYAISLVVMSIPFVVCLGLMSKNTALEDRLLVLEQEQKELHSDFEENLNEIYLLYSQNASKVRTIMNMTTRNYHYLAEHGTDPQGFCPECFDLIRRNGEAKQSEQFKKDIKGE